MDARDPGWRPALRPLFRSVLIPFLSTRKQARNTPTLVGLRTLVLVLPIQWLLFLGLLRITGPDTDRGGRWVPIVVGIDGLIAIRLVMAFVRKQPLDASDLPSLAASYRALFLVGWAVVDGVVLFGFVGFFLAGHLWVYLLAIPPAAVGLGFLAPTRSEIDRRQRELRSMGSSLSLLEALMLPGDQLPRWKRSRSR
jgi:hypothetical protein